MGNAEWGMGNAEWGMRNSEWGMGNSEWGKGNAECGMGNEEFGMGNGEFKGVGTVADSTGYPVSFTEKNYHYLSAYAGEGKVISRHGLS